MSLPIHVEAYSGYKANERQISFSLNPTIGENGPCIEFLSVEPATIRTAESKTAGCERCRNDESDIPFNFVIADVLGRHGAFEFILSEQGHCPNCRGELSERTLVEPQGGIEVEIVL